MRVYFKDTDLEAILRGINQELTQSSLKKMIGFTIEGSFVVLTISKLGKSYIKLSSQSFEKGLLFQVAEEHVLPHHQVLRPMVMGQLEKVLTKAGAEIR